MAADHVAGLAFGDQQPHSPSDHVVDPNVLVIHSVKVSVHLILVQAFSDSFLMLYTERGGAALKSCERGPWDKSVICLFIKKITFIFTTYMYIYTLDTIVILLFTCTSYEV